MGVSGGRGEFPARADVLAPDLRGFGVAYKRQDDAPHAYSAPAQARSVLGSWMSSV